VSFLIDHFLYLWYNLVYSITNSDQKGGAMAKMVYSAPVIRTEAIEIGVFGSYGSSGGGIMKHAGGGGKKRSWLWWLFPWNW
jgi:hypothetical protein